MKVVIAVFCSLLVSYLYVINSDFIGDDVNRILFNPELKNFYSAVFGDLGDRPIVMLFTTAIAKIAGLETTIFFRLFSFLIHSLVAYQLYLLIKEVNNVSEHSSSGKIAFFGALLFALHPLHNQAITTSIQSGVLLAGFFGLVSLRFFFKFASEGNNRLFCISLSSLAMGLLSKPIVSFLPIYYLLFSSKMSATKKKKLIVFLLYFAVLLIPVFFYHILGKNIQHNSLSPISYFLVQMEVWLKYLYLILVPYGFQFLYDFYPSNELVFNINWLLFLAHLLIIFASFFLFKKRVLFYLLVGFYFSLLPESSFFSIQHLAFDHRTYFPLMFFFALVSSFFIQKNYLNKKNLINIIGIAVAVLYVILNQNRNLQIKKYPDWALHALRNSETHHYSNFMFSTLLMRAGYIEEVAPYIEKYNKKFPSIDYQILSKIQEYYTYKKRGDKDLNIFLANFCYYLRESSIKDHVRLFLNKIIIEEFAHENDDIYILVMVEKTLSFQLAKLFNKKSFFALAIHNYYTLANFLLSENIKEKFYEIDSINFLKTKVMLFHYYGQSFDNLENELKTELEKNPKSEVLLKISDLFKKGIRKN